jgi:Na+-driven multidrug efflux pump
MNETLSNVQAAPLPRSLWRDIRAVLVGAPVDCTTGSIGRAVLILAVPMVLEMSMQSLFGVVDVFFVGKLGPEAVAVVGVTDSILMLVFAVAIGLSMGTTAMVARRVGEGDLPAAARAAVQAILLGTGISVPLGIAGVWLAPDLIRLMGGSPALASQGSAFTAIILGGAGTVTLLFLINGVFRGAGDPTLAMQSLWIANGLNIVLDPILIFGWGPFPEMGLTGAGIATTASRGIGVLYQLSRLSLRSGRIRIAPRDWALDIAVMGLVRIVAAFGEASLAGYTIAVRVIVFVLLPAWGVGNAAATLVGQNLGAGNPDRGERAVWLTGHTNAGFLALVAVVFLAIPEAMAGVFTADPEAIRVASDCLRIVSLSYVFWAYGMVTVVAFNGAGDTTTPTWLHFWAYWVLQIPLAYVLAVVLGYGPRGVFTAIAVGQMTLAVLGVRAFRRGRWKDKAI